MKKKLNYYNIFMTTMIVVIAGLLLATGIIALQKSMNLKVGVNITPSHEIRIDYGGETIFCNTTKDSAGIKVASGYTLSGNTLTFTQEFISIGETFALTIYNYNTSYLQVSVSGTGASGNTLTIAPYSTTASSGVLNLTIGAGASEAVLSFSVPVTYSISAIGDTYTLSGDDIIVEGCSYSTSINTTSEFYNLPEAITITMGGEVLTSGYTYTKTSDTIATLTINSVTGNVEITCEATGDVVSVYIELYVAPEDKTYTANTSITYPNTTCSPTFHTSIKFNPFDDGSGSSGSSGSSGGSSSSPTYVDGFYSKQSYGATGSVLYKYRTITITVYIKWGEVAESINVLETYGTSSS